MYGVHNAEFGLRVGFGVYALDHSRGSHSEVLEGTVVGGRRVGPPGDHSFEIMPT